MEFIKRNKIILMRVVGALMLLIGFVIHFWVTPKEVLTKSEIAAANVARMERSVARNSHSSQSSQRKTSSQVPKFMEKFKDAKKKQMEFLTIFAMIFGVGFLGYSFVKKE